MKKNIIISMFILLSTAFELEAQGLPQNSSLLELEPLTTPSLEAGFETEEDTIEPLELTSSEFSRMMTDVIEKQTKWFNNLQLGLDPDFVRKTEGYTIDQLIEAAYNNNPDLLDTRTAYLRSLTQIKSAQALRLPSVDFQTSITGIGNPLDPISVQAGEFGIIDAGGEEILLPSEDMLLYSGMESMNYDFKVTVDQAIYTWGKISTGIDMAGIGAEIALQQVQKKEDEIRTQMIISCRSLYYMDKIHQILLIQKQLGDRLFEISQESYTNGFLIYSDVLEARVQSMEIDAALFRLEGQITNLESTLRYLTGIEDFNHQEIILEESPVTIFVQAFPNVEELKALSASYSHDLAILENLVKLAENQAHLDSVTDYLHPDFGLHLEMSYGGSRFPFIEKDWFGVDDYQITLSLGIADTLYDGGASSAAKEDSLLGIDSSRYQYQTALNGINQFLDETIINKEINKQNIVYYGLKLENSLIQIDIKKTQWETGVGGEPDYLLEIIDMLTILISGIQETLDYTNNSYKLLSVSGQL